MSTGDRRGLIDMDIQLDYFAAQKLVLLEGLSSDVVDDPSILSAFGLMTESGDFKFIRDQYIKDYYIANQEKPLAYEQSSEALVLNETQLSVDPSSLPDELSDNMPHAIQLTPSWWLSADNISKDILSAFNKKNQCMRVVFEFEFDEQHNEKACLDGNTLKTLPLNDLLDLCIKSRFKKTLKNSNVPFNLDQSENDVATYNANVDQWLVLDEYPIDFCQCNGDTYMLTQPSINQPYKFKSSSEMQLLGSDSQLEHDFSYESEKIQTYLYKGPQEYGTSTYEQYLSSNDNLVTQENLISVFTPYEKIENIRYNYIVNLDQCRSASTAYDNPTIYENGDIYGGFNLAKNMYNSLYSIDMQDRKTMLNCRRYCGIHNSANTIVLKYYDDANYELVKNSNNDSTTAIPAKSGKMVPYQKIEVFQPQKMTNSCQHKSNLFSIRISNTALDDAYAANRGDAYASMATNIKKDIANGVRELANSIAPANTQLFKTYFG